MEDVKLITNVVTIYHAIEILNEAIKLEPDATTALFKILMPCSTRIEESRTLEYSKLDDDTTVVTFLGILNGIFSYTDGTHKYRIFPVYEDQRIVEFRLGVQA